MVPLRTALAMVVCAVGIFCLGVTAHARVGRSGVEARSFFTIAGTLSGVPSVPAPTIVFVFHRPATADCTTTAERSKRPAKAIS